MPVKKKGKPEAGEKEAPSEEEQQRLVDEAIEKSEKLAESQLDMAHLFLSHGKADIARRRLEELIERYGRSEAAKEARKLLETI